MKKRYVYTLVFLLAATLATLAYADVAKRYKATYGDFSNLTVTTSASIAGLGDMVPATDNAEDLGSSTVEWRNLYVDGTANIDSLVADTADINGGTIDGATVGASSASTGAFTTLAASTSATIGGGTAVTGLLHTTVTVASGATTNTVSLAGITTDYSIFATINSGNANNAYITQTDVAAGLVSVEISADPGADTVVSILAIK